MDYQERSLVGRKTITLVVVNLQFNIIGKKLIARNSFIACSMNYSIVIGF